MIESAMNCGGVIRTEGRTKGLLQYHYLHHKSQMKQYWLKAGLRTYKFGASLVFYLITLFIPKFINGRIWMNFFQVTSIRSKTVIGKHREQCERHPSVYLSIENEKRLYEKLNLRITSASDSGIRSWMLGSMQGSSGNSVRSGGKASAGICNWYDWVGLGNLGTA